KKKKKKLCVLYVRTSLFLPKDVIFALTVVIVDVHQV
ncbi:uncharacterized protein METZ01_LOCUS398980, partial [marine metagenome]